MELGYGAEGEEEPGAEGQVKRRLRRRRSRADSRCADPAVWRNGRSRSRQGRRRVGKKNARRRRTAPHVAAIAAPEAEDVGVDGPGDVEAGGRLQPRRSRGELVDALTHVAAEIGDESAGTSTQGGGVFCAAAVEDARRTRGRASETHARLLWFRRGPSIKAWKAYSGRGGAGLGRGGGVGAVEGKGDRCHDDWRARSRLAASCVGRGGLGSGTERRGGGDRDRRRRFRGHLAARGAGSECQHGAITRQRSTREPRSARDACARRAVVLAAVMAFHLGEHIPVPTSHSDSCGAGDQRSPHRSPGAE